MSTHQQLLYHVVFSTKNRKPLLTEALREKVFAYMAGIAGNLGGFAVAVNGWYDHVHLLLRIPPKISVSAFVGQLKASTSKHINESARTSARFGWQDGFGVFTVSPSQKDHVIRYIENQTEHHRKVSFKDEYLKLLRRHDIEFDPKYVWE